LEKRLSGVAELRYISLYGKSQINLSGLKIERKAGEDTYNFGQRGKKTLTFGKIEKNGRADG
jgi:hypothetical protein